MPIPPELSALSSASALEQLEGELEEPEHQVQLNESMNSSSSTTITQYRRNPGRQRVSASTTSTVNTLRSVGGSVRTVDTMCSSVSTMSALSVTSLAALTSYIKQVTVAVVVVLVGVGLEAVGVSGLAWA